VECALLDLQGKKRLQIAESCQCLITDLQEQKRNAKGEIDKTNEEISHASEALGYMVWYLRPIRPARVTQGEARFITAA
jgi:hypothetical protein